MKIHYTNRLLSNFILPLIGVRLKIYFLVNKIIFSLNIGTAADIMEFFESYKDVNIIKIDLLVFLTLGIWSWSLMQFTIVLSATRARRPRGGGIHHDDGYVGLNSYFMLILI